MKISNNKKAIIGHSSFDGSKMIVDEQANRIDWLVKNYLIKVSSNGSNWTILYQDPGDKRYWELSFPETDERSSGPPSLIVLSEVEAKKKYQF